jgi:hypothetical protein
MESIAEWLNITVVADTYKNFLAGVTDTTYQYVGNMIIIIPGQGEFG